MANEIKTSFKITYENGVLKHRLEPLADYPFNQTTSGFKAFTWALGSAAEENLDLTDLTACRLIYLRNLDPTNYCDIGMSDSGTMKALIRLLGATTYQDFCFFPLKPSTTIRGQANTAGVKVQVLGFET